MKKLLALSLLISASAFADGNGGERGGELDFVLNGAEIHCIDLEAKKHQFHCTDTFCSVSETCKQNKMEVDYTSFPLSE